MQTNIANELGNVLIVGGGRMGTAIAEGLLHLEGFTYDQLTIADPDPQKLQEHKALMGVSTTFDASTGMPADTIILAVKPNHIPDAAASLVAGGLTPATLVISIAAGISTARLADLLGPDISIVRVMPNTPLLCGCGMSAISPGAHADERDAELVRLLFASMGKAVIVEEDLQDVVCAVSGSGPAYYELFCEIIARAGERLGLTYELSLELALQTMLGTATLIDATGQSLPEAIDAVSSPGGTTIAALDAMHANGLDDAISEGVAAAALRSKELGS